MDWLPAPTDLGATALLALVVFLILTGRLVPRSHLQDIRHQYEIRLAEEKETSHEWMVTAKTKDEQVKVLSEQGQTMVALLHSIHDASERKP